MLRVLLPIAVLLVPAIPAVAQPAPTDPLPAASSPDRQPPGALLDEVLITPTGRPTRRRDTTATVYVITRQEMRAVGAVTVQDALRLVPGISP